MKKTEMLKKNYEFKKVLNTGAFFKGQQIGIYYLKNSSLKNFLGIAVSKNSGTSVERNQIKRLIRENYRLLENHISVRK